MFTKIFVDSCSVSQQGVMERRLLNDLLIHRSYNKLERPVYNETEPLTVVFGLTLQQIIDVVSDFCTLYLFEDKNLRKLPIWPTFGCNVIHSDTAGKLFFHDKFLDYMPRNTKFRLNATPISKLLLPAVERFMMSRLLPPACVRCWIRALKRALKF
jgi:hypothetical protein